MFLDWKISGVEGFGGGAETQRLEDLPERTFAFSMNLPESRHRLFQAYLRLQPGCKIPPEFIDRRTGFPREAVDKSSHALPIIERGKSG